MNSRAINFSIKRGESLTADLIGIGISLHGEGTKNPKIEETLISATIEGIGEDARTLGLIVDWIDKHSQRINASLLYEMLIRLNNDKLNILWSAIAKWKCKDVRFRKIAGLYMGKRTNIFKMNAEFLIKRNGEDERFRNTHLMLPNKYLGARPQYILEPDSLQKFNVFYKWRVVIGPTFRADMWACLELNKNMNPAELMRETQGSYATAWNTRRDYFLFNS